MLAIPVALALIAAACGDSGNSSAGTPGGCAASCAIPRAQSPTSSPPATNVLPSLMQTYLRDTGELVVDLAMPIHLRGRHWGALRVGFSPLALIKDERTGSHPS